MSSFYGMNVEEVRQLASQMTQRSSEIRSLMNQLTSALQNTQWVGPDHDRFLNEWQSTYVAQLNQVANGLEEAANLATANANAQEQASTM